MQNKFDGLVDDKQAHGSNDKSLFNELEKAERKCKVLETQILELTSTYAKEIANLKAKVTQKDAQILINNESSIPFVGTPTMHKTGAFKKDTGKGLEPLEKSLAFIQKNASEYGIKSYQEFKKEAKASAFDKKEEHPSSYSKPYKY